MNPTKKNSVKEQFFQGLIIATIVCIGVFIIGALGIEATWPAFFIMISFFITGADVKNLPNIFGGCITGLILAFLLLLAAMPTMTALGETLGVLVLVWIIVFSMVFGQEFVPQAFNDFAFIYFTLALIFAAKALTMTHAAIASEYLTWGLTAILGGGGILAGIIICITLARKAGLLPPV